MNAEYNDIVQWKYQDLVTVFGGTDRTTKRHQVRTKDELNTLLTDEKFNEYGGVQFVEMYMDKEDAPRALVLTAEASARTNAKDM